MLVHPVRIVGEEPSGHPVHQRLSFLPSVIVADDEARFSVSNQSHTDVPTSRMRRGARMKRGIGASTLLLFFLISCAIAGASIAALLYYGQLLDEPTTERTSKLPSPSAPSTD